MLRSILDASTRERRCHNRMEDGEIEIDSVKLIGLTDISPTLARESGFLGVLDLLKVAKHGKGELIFLVRFHFVPPIARRPQKGRSSEEVGPQKS